MKINEFFEIARLFKKLPSNRILTKKQRLVFIFVLWDSTTRKRVENTELFERHFCVKT